MEKKRFNAFTFGGGITMNREQREREEEKRLGEERLANCGTNR